MTPNPSALDALHLLHNGYHSAESLIAGSPTALPANAGSFRADDTLLPTSSVRPDYNIAKLSMYSLSAYIMYVSSDIGSHVPAASSLLTHTLALDVAYQYSSTSAAWQQSHTSNHPRP